MHIPDGFLSPPVWATFDVLSVPAVGLMARRAQRQMDDRKIPLLGVMGAFVFAAQMVQFPVGPGTSGHLVGGTLLAIALGPAAAAMVMTAILAIQAFVFQDGGIVALGANIFNMAVAGVLVGYLPYRLWGAGPRRFWAIFAGGALSVFASACLALLQLLISGVSMPGHLFAVSLGLFLVSGLLEGAITVAAVRAIERLNPGWIRSPNEPGLRLVGVVATAAVTLVVLGVVVASTAPDGIWKLARELGLTSRSPAWLQSPLADYQLAGFESVWVQRVLAGLAGIAVIYVVCLVTGKILARQRSA
jgi:cobalt/nickel transport system permease protein